MSEQQTALLKRLADLVKKNRAAYRVALDEFRRSFSLSEGSE